MNKKPASNSGVKRKTSSKAPTVTKPKVGNKRPRSKSGVVPAPQQSPPSPKPKVSRKPRSAKANALNAYEAAEAKQIIDLEKKEPSAGDD